jgi:hypothetical protein
MHFMFNHTFDALLPFLQETTQYIKSNIPEGVGEMVLHKSKFVLTELCTNGIKHAGVPQSSFDITIGYDCVAIVRKDLGEPVYINAQPNNPSALSIDITSMVTLVEDDINRLMMQPTDSQSMRFFVEEVAGAAKKNGPTLVEHFGFIIICQSSSSFTYTRLPTGENVFSVSIPLA